MVDEAETTSDKNSNKPSISTLRGVGLSILILAAVAGFYYIKANKEKTEEVHYHAGFQVYKDGKLEDFSDAKYMTIGFCGNEDNVDEQLEKAHLHDNVGDVVHVHREGGVWKDLFTNINYQLSADQIKKAFVNGNEIDDILNYPIKQFDSVVLVLGEIGKDKDYKSMMVPISRIEEVEAKSEVCGN